MNLTKRQKFIEELATQILKDSGETNAPIDVNKIAQSKGIKVVGYDFGEDISGVLVIDNGSAAIGYNQNNHPNRTRFTIAHELGHFALGHKRDGDFIDTPEKYFTVLFRDQNSSTGEHIQEREANAFAAALLMPAELITKTINETSFNFKKDDVVEILAKKFNVSNQAMAFRLGHLGFQW